MLRIIFMSLIAFNCYADPSPEVLRQALADLGIAPKEWRLTNAGPKLIDDPKTLICR